MAAPEFPKESTSGYRHELAGSLLQGIEHTQKFDTSPLLDQTVGFPMRLDGHQ